MDPIFGLFFITCGVYGIYTQVKYGKDDPRDKKVADYNQKIVTSILNKLVKDQQIPQPKSTRNNKLAWEKMICVLRGKPLIN